MKNLWIVAGLASLLMAGCGHDRDQPHTLIAAGSASSRVFVDPATGKVRKPTAEELRALPRATTPATTPQLRSYTLPNGTTIVKFGPEMMQRMSAETGPDGELHARCNTPKSGEEQP